MSSVASDGPLVLAVDSSTTSSKAVVVDAEGRVLSTSRREIPLSTPATAFYEHDPRDWWTSTNESVGAAVADLPEKDRGRIAAMALTHQRETFAAVDDKGAPLRPGILWLDGRATDQIRRYGSPHVHALSGKPADVTPALYKMAWVKEHEPDVFARAHKVVEVHAYLVWCLTGKWTTSVAAADSLGLFDIERLDYSAELLDIAGVTREQMADLVAPGRIIADVRREVREAWGMAQAIPVVAGLGDGQAAAIGAAAVDPDIGYLNLGTAVNAGVHGTRYEHGAVYRTLAAGLPGRYVFEVLQSSGSYLAGWFREKLGEPSLLGAPDPKLDAEAAEVGPGCDGLVTLPYWNAVQSPYWDSIARGAVVGWHGAHGRASMYRSILEAIGYEMKANLAGLEAATGTRLTTLRAMGGGTRSALWIQIMADVIGVPITHCLEDEISALGAAVLAMSTTGAHGEPDIATSARAMASFGRVTEPDPVATRRYADYGAVQSKLYGQLKGVFEDLHALSEKYRSPHAGGVR